MTTVYDTIVYPSMIFEQTHPERLRIVAKLHGIDAPAHETARVLEIGGGDGLNLIAFAAANSRADCHGFDLAETAVSRGRKLVADAGLRNVDLRTLDILDAREAYPAGIFDYIIAHGVYAWVPEPVRDAIMALVGHALSPNGVAFISYNAMPGGYIRMMMRDLLLHALDGVEGVEARISVTHQCLELFSKPRDGDDVVVQALRKQAENMLERPDEVLFHDELGGVFAPQRLTDVARHAAAHGLKFLSDEAGARPQMDGFLPEDVAPVGDLDALVIRAAQAADNSAVRFFRQSLFVRAAHRPLRTINLSKLDGLWMSSQLKRDGDVFRTGRSSFQLSDDELSHMIEVVSQHYPERFHFAEKVVDDDRRTTMLQLYGRSYVRFHFGPAPFSLAAGERPCTSALVRAQLRDGNEEVCNLDHRVMRVEQPELRALLMAADGTRTIAEIAALGDLDFPPEHVKPALDAAARRGLVV